MNLLTGISANIFATACTDKYAVGPEPAIFGIMGGLIGAYLYLWEQIHLITCYKIGGCCLLVFLTLMGILLVTATAKPYNVYTNLLQLEYPDTFGIMNGLLYGS